MKTKMLLAGLLYTTTCFAELDHLGESNPQIELPKMKKDHFYVGLGVGPLIIPAPNFNFGWRKQSGHHGIDIGINVIPLIGINYFKGYVNYFYYLNPSAADAQIYIGGGIGTGPLFLVGGECFSGVCFISNADLIIGRSFQTGKGKNRFIQADIHYPMVESRKLLWQRPLLTLYYGFGF